MTIPAGATASPDFYYQDTKAGSPTLTAAATGFASASQTEAVTAAALASMTVSPGTATVTAGGSQAFTATGADPYGNPVDVSGATWSTTVPGSSVSPSTGASTTFTAGSTAASGSVTATVNTIQASAAVTVTSTSAPAAPTNLTATSRGKRIALSWSGSNGVTYRVYRGTSSGGESLYVSGLTRTSFNDSNLTSGVTYYYYVTAVGPGGESSPSAEASAKAK
jgi:hypothetical protein